MSNATGAQSVTAPAPRTFKCHQRRQTAITNRVNTGPQHRSFLIYGDVKLYTQSSGSYCKAGITNAVAFLMPLFNAIPILLTRTEAPAEQLLIKS